jgi:butyrate kinase
MKPTRLTSVAVISLSALLSACDQGCENEVARSIASPSGKLKVVVFHRGCGATTGFNTQASILKATDSLPNDGGNIFAVEGKVPMQIQWISEEKVSILGLGSARVFKQEHSASGIAVAYQ